MRGVHVDRNAIDLLRFFYKCISGLELVNDEYLFIFGRQAVRRRMVRCCVVAAWAAPSLSSMLSQNDHCFLQ